MYAAETGQWRKMRKLIPEALYPSTLLIDGNQQVRITQLVQRVDQCPELPGRCVIAAEQDDPPDGRVTQ
jgi:hypothetical protein